jgi:hypothetical protein
MRPPKKVSDGPSGRSWCRYCTEIVYFKSPMYMAFPIAADPADRVVGPLSPLPCHAWHGYGVSSAHHGEVRGCRRAYERPPSGAAAAAPPAGAVYYHTLSERTVHGRIPRCMTLTCEEESKPTWLSRAYRHAKV